MKIFQWLLQVHSFSQSLSSFSESHEFFMCFITQIFQCFSFRIFFKTFSGIPHSHQKRHMECVLLLFCFVVACKFFFHKIFALFFVLFIFWKTCFNGFFSVHDDVYVEFDIYYLKLVASNSIVLSRKHHLNKCLVAYTDSDFDAKKSQWLPLDQR